MRLNEKVAVITGGGTGIGKETALLFAQEGAKVILTDIHETSGQGTVEEIKANGGEAIFVRHDVSNENDWRKVANEAIKAYNQVDILFNNAGIYLIKPLAEIELEEWNKLMAINVGGVFLGMKHIMPLMAERQKGSVINASSIAGLVGSPGHVLYGASKGAVRVMTKDAAIEYAPMGVRVNSIHPGYIDTGMADYASEQTGQSKDALGKNLFPLGYLGKVKDVANTVLFLASDDSAYTTGAEFVIDGGATAR
ncbi:MULTISPECIES: SDR family NAD(P)-dependent oxidoreductase [Cytobacillus]|uniref:SDR family NAD(P)-dependent oxidoreductase n=1 Tax=Cytobacillus TaxID=2675230 RepID=UPI001CD3C490|nr:glucose 1-dehydrogenase [Cytobacillus kochii]MCA1028409.1 glucose 1-dehydrogenase [Cytobacillus kochii]MCM3321769.1 glucose 1-dehydrogenase [Cytobacillus kochii]MCM3343397.1 glucose 1-dehydrogenase [Cytobacillus kochii]MDM5207228.1 glucose 1-dehydrogenase [Cytobacillus kochii]